jgi:hypothetical protein
MLRHTRYFNKNAEPFLFLAKLALATENMHPFTITSGCSEELTGVSEFFCSLCSCLAVRLFHVLVEFESGVNCYRCVVAVRQK